MFKKGRMHLKRWNLSNKTVIVSVLNQDKGHKHTHTHREKRENYC